MNRSGSTVVQQAQWLVSASTTAIGTYILGSDSSGNFGLSTGNGSALSEVAHWDRFGNFTTGGLSTPGNLSVTGQTELAGYTGIGAPTTSTYELEVTGTTYSSLGFYTPTLSALTAINVPNGGMTRYGTQRFSIAAGGAVSLGGSLSVGSFQINGTQIIDSSQDLVLSGYIQAAGVSTTGTSSIVSAGNVTSVGYVKSNGGFYEGATQFLDTSLDLINIANLTMSGTLTANGNVSIPSGSLTLAGAFSGSTVSTSLWISASGQLISYSSLADAIYAPTGGLLLGGPISATTISLSGTGTMAGLTLFSLGSSSGGSMVCISGTGILYKGTSTGC
jgi:hypothetical protein